MVVQELTAHSEILKHTNHSICTSPMSDYQCKLKASVLNRTIVTDPTIRQPGCHLPLMNRFRTGQGPRDHSWWHIRKYWNTQTTPSAHHQCQITNVNWRLLFSTVLLLPTLLSDSQVAISLVIRGLWWTVSRQVKAHIVTMYHIVDSDH